MIYARILILFGENVVRCWFVSSTINCLLLLSQLIYLLFILNKGKKDIVF
jgi:hypothetical protein